MAIVKLTKYIYMLGHLRTIYGSLTYKTPCDYTKRIFSDIAFLPIGCTLYNCQRRLKQKNYHLQTSTRGSKKEL